MCRFNYIDNDPEVAPSLAAADLAARPDRPVAINFDTVIWQCDRLIFYHTEERRGHVKTSKKRVAEMQDDSDWMENLLQQAVRFETFELHWAAI